jgi:predicted Zn finger-like uncharacterized protein
MLIVCPNCTTSYQIDPASVGPAGRTVRCARCKMTWFAGGPKSAPEISAFVDGVIAEAEAQSGGGSAQQSEPARQSSAPVDDDFGNNQATPEPVAREPEPLPAEQPAYRTDLAPFAPEPISIPDAPSLVPMEQAPLAEAPHEVEPHNEDIETFAARRQRLRMKRQKKRRSTRWTAIVLVLFAFNVALIGARQEVVRFLPQTASLFSAIGLPVNLRRLKFENVHISRDLQDGVAMLMIEGAIVSTAGKPVEVPRLRFAARNATGQEVYTWTALPSRSILEPGARLDFSSHLASPPPEATDIIVRFFNAHDVVSGSK